MSSLTAIQSKEIVVKVRNDVGILAQMTRIVAEKGVSVLAAAAWVEDTSGVIHMVTDDNLRATDALRAHKYAPEEKASLLVELPHKPGMISGLCGKLADGGINIRYLYMTAPINQDRCVLVLDTEDNERAMVILDEW
ncbi:hypothetical protein ACFLQY_01320 [Verrucomicrobiota bacterium]